MVTSRRLQAAASAEARRLIKRRDRITARIAPLQAEIDRIDEQIALIEKAAGLVLDTPMEPGSKDWPPAEIAGVPLAGKAIRVQAIRSMTARHELGHAAHAREWFEAYRADGYTVAAADPFPAFLTQLGRSPWVESSSQRDIYALTTPSPLPALRAEIARVYDRAQAATDPEEKMEYLREARRLMRLRAECEECGPTWGAEWPSDPVNAERPASGVSGA